MKRPSRRKFLQGSVLAEVGLLSGCGMLRLPGQQSARVPRIGFLGVGSREGRAFLIEGLLEQTSSEFRLHMFAVGLAESYVEGR